MSCIIHIGHPKTGSSAIQSQLSKSENVLAAEGLTYPFHSSMRKAQKGLVSSGNGTLILDEKHRIKPNSVYSSELLFDRLANDEKLVSLMKRLPEDMVIVLYTRDLFDMSYSDWGQQIKRQGYTSPYPHYVLNDYGEHLHLVKYWLAAAERFGFKIKVFNYSRVKSNVLEHFLREVLGVKSGCGYQSNSIVNRSLTMGEYEIQRLFNKYLKARSSHFISDNLVNKLPDIQSEKPSLERSAYVAVVDRLIPDIECINARLDKAASIQIEPFEKLSGTNAASDTAEFRFTQPQLEVLVSGICDVLNARQINADLLRDMAVKIERDEKLDLADALSLMSLAQSARPKGPFIKKKVEEYKAKLKKA